MTDILVSLHGNRIGLSEDAELIIDGIKYTDATPSPLWREAPALNAQDPSRFFLFFDDFINPASATASDNQAYTVTSDGAAMVAGTAQNITLSGLEEMHLVFGVKAGPGGAAETLQVDYIKCMQLR